MGTASANGILNWVDKLGHWVKERQRDLLKDGLSCVIAEESQASSWAISISSDTEELCRQTNYNGFTKIIVSLSSRISGIS